MKKNILFTLLMAAALSAGAQTAEKTVKLTDNSLLVYNVDEGNSTKNGTYAIKNLRNDGIWLQGNYKNDTRIGTWYFFDSKNKLMMKYNYDQKKVGYIDTTALAAVSVAVLSNDPEVTKNASAPLPLCSIDYMVSLIASKLYTKTGDAVAEITAHVTADGKATYSVSYVQNNKKSPKKKIEFDNSNFWIDWVPSMANNKPVDSEFTIYATISGNETAPASAERRFRWN